MSIAAAFRAEFDRLRESVLAEVRAYVDRRLAELGPLEQTEPAGEWLTVKELWTHFKVKPGTFHDWKSDPDSGLKEGVHWRKPGRLVLVNRERFGEWYWARG